MALEREQFPRGSKEAKNGREPPKRARHQLFSGPSSSSLDALGGFCFQLMELCSGCLQKTPSSGCSCSKNVHLPSIPFILLRKLSFFFLFMILASPDSALKLSGL